MRSEEFEKLLATVRQADLTLEQRHQLEKAVKLPRGRPKKEPTVGDLLEKYSAALTMRQLQRAGETYDEAAELAAQEHGVKANTLKSWVKRYDLHSWADWRIQAFDEPRRQAFYRSERAREILAEADDLGIDYAPDWPMSRIKAEIQRARCKK